MSSDFMLHSGRQSKLSGQMGLSIALSEGHGITWPPQALGRTPAMP